jgi:predicted PurR-regulated permease PerM
MKPGPRPTKRDAPHPLLMLAGVVIALALVVISLKTTLLPRSYAVVLAISFVIIIRWLSRRSAAAMRERRQRELEQLRSTPVLHLDD